MKTIKIMMMALMMCFVANSFGQSTYEKVDSVSKTKDQIYSDTKMFIAEYWKSAQNVIQNDDKDGGMILVKGNFKLYQKYNFMLTFEYVYSYTIKYLFKDNKYKVSIDAYCYSNHYTTDNSTSCPLVDPCLNCEYPGYKKTWLKENMWKELQVKIDNELKSILNAYSSYISKPSQTNNW